MSIEFQLSQVVKELSKSLGCPELGEHVAAAISLYLVSVGWIWLLPFAAPCEWFMGEGSFRGPLTKTPPWPRCLLIAWRCRDSYKYFYKQKNKLKKVNRIANETYHNYWYCNNHIHDITNIRLLLKMLLVELLIDNNNNGYAVWETRFI